MFYQNFEDKEKIRIYLCICFLSVSINISINDLICRDITNIDKFNDWINYKKNTVVVLWTTKLFLMSKLRSFCHQQKKLMGF